jgi:hypothetical protein
MQTMQTRTNRIRRFAPAPPALGSDAVPVPRRAGTYCEASSSDRIAGSVCSKPATGRKNLLQQPRTICRCQNQGCGYPVSATVPISGFHSKAAAVVPRFAGFCSTSAI